jgi:hypothetical protein
MVAPSFPWFRQSGRDDPNPRAALCVDDGKEVVLDHAEQDIATLAVVLTPVLTYHSERVIEGQASCLETYAVIGQILGGLDVIPLKSSFIYYGVPVSCKDVERPWDGSWPFASALSA